MNGKLVDLDPKIRAKASIVFDEMKSSQKLKDLGVQDIAIVETRRSLVRQMAYYSRSRMSVKDVQYMYEVAGLYPISEVEAKIPNTWTLESKHIEGKAVDFAPMNSQGIWWNAPIEVWEEMGKIGEKHGLKWGGRWEIPDRPHFEV